MKRVLVFAALLAGCSHSAAVQMRYAGIVPIVGGGLLTVEPSIAGRGSDRQTTEIGVGIAIGGLALIVAGCIVDPEGC